MFAQRLAQRQLADLGHRDRLFAVQAGEGEHLLDQFRAVARLHAQGVAGLVGQGLRGFETEQPDLLVRSGTVESLIDDQPRGHRRRATGRGQRGDGYLGGLGRQLPLQGGQPGIGGVEAIGVAVQPRAEAVGAEFGQAGVEALAVAAELLVGGIAQGQHGVVQLGEGGIEATEALPEGLAIVRGFAVAKGAAHQQDAAGTAQAFHGIGGHVVQFDGETGLAQAGDAALGQGFGVAGLGGPEHHQIGRRGSGLGQAGTLALRQAAE